MIDSREVPFSMSGDALGSALAFLILLSLLICPYLTMT
jgi:hypothetical protein